MKCSKCGQENKDSSQFCAFCGGKLEAVPAGVQVVPAAQPAPSGQQPFTQPYNNAQQPYGQAPYGAPVPPPQTEGPLGAAWKDITSTPGWVKKVLLLCLVGCVPILNFAVVGYCVRWGRELSFGKRESMPTTIFRKKEISTGFFAILVSLGLGMAFGLVTIIGFLLVAGLFGCIHPAVGAVVGVLLAIAITLFFYIAYNPVIDACVMRMSVVGYLESGFNFKVAFQAFRKGMGGLIGASLVPRIVVGIISAIVSFIIVFIFVFIASLIASAVGGAVSSDPLSAANFVSRNPMLVWSGASGAMYFAMLGYLLSFIASSMFTVFASLFTYRAVGHWVARFAPEWAGESEEGLQADAGIGAGV